VAGLDRSVCDCVLGRVRPTKTAIEAECGCGLRDLVLEATWLGPCAAAKAARQKAYATRDIAPNVPIGGLPRPEMVDDPTAAGSTHASVAADARAT
jgi:hypothetical protein